MSNKTKNSGYRQSLNHTGKFTPTENKITLRKQDSKKV